MRNPRKLGVAAAMTVAVTALFTGCATSDGGNGGDVANPDLTIETMEPVTLRVAESIPEQSGAAIALQNWGSYVTEQTDGKVQFEYYFSSTLLSSGEAYPGVTDGVADIVQITASLFPETFPVSSWIAQAGMTAPTTFPNSVLTVRSAAIDYYLSSEAVFEETSAVNARWLLAGSTNYGTMMCNKPVRTLEDAKGLRVVIDGGTSIPQAQALGMEVMQMSTADYFESLQRGVVDCLQAGDGGDTFMALGIPEVAPYFHNTLLSPNPGSGYMINLEAWNKLPTEVHDIMLAGIGQWEVDRNKGRMDGYTKFVEDAEAKGVEWVDAAELNSVILQQQQDQLDAMIDNAPAGVADPQAEIDLFKGKVSEWATTMEGLIDTQFAGEQPTVEELIAAYRLGSSSVNWDGWRDELSQTLSGS